MHEVNLLNFWTDLCLLYSRVRNPLLKRYVYTSMGYKLFGLFVGLSNLREHSRPRLFFFCLLSVSVNSVKSIPTP